MLRLLAGAIRKPDDRERGHSGLEVRFDLDLARLEADERVSDRASEHSRHGRHGGAPEGHASMESSLRNGYGT